MGIQQTNNELLEQLKEQINFLKTSSREFDNGNYAEAKRLATNIRILLHDTRNSISLLKQLDIKEKIYYIDTASDYDPKNLISHHGLVGIKVSKNDTRFFPFLTKEKCKFTIFDKWWNKIVISDKNNKKFTRKKLILALANQDGGAHVDPELNEAYAELSRNNSVGWFTNNNLPILKIELFSVRQIAFELILTLEDYLKNKSNKS